MANFDRVKERIRVGRPADNPGTAVMVGRVVTPSTAIAVGKFLTVTPLSVLGAEVEGGAGATTVDSSAAIAVYLVGPQPAQQGDLLVCRFVDFRWVADRGGSTVVVGHNLTGCPCPVIPDTFSMHVKSQPPSRTESFAFPATFQRMTRPAVLATYRTAPVGWYSTQVYQSSDHYYKYYYSFGCSQGLYFVTCLMTPDSPVGYPGEFLIMNWLVGLPGNSCSPFLLSNGNSGSNSTFPTQGISLDAKGPT